MKVVHEILRIVAEARRDRYIQMFPAKFIDPDFQIQARKKFEEDIDNARKILKKENWCVWYLRWRRIDLVFEYGFEGAAQAFVKQASKESGFSERQVESEATNNFSDTRRLGANDSMYRHYMSLMDSIPEIGNFNPGWMDAGTVFSKLHNIEKAWNERAKRFVPDSKVSELVEELIDFGNGLKWFNLHEDGCRAEADAMGHCSTGGHTGDINLSLRRRGKIEGVEGWIPELTFIWNENTGFLGEMKGPENSKPKPEFFKYIVKLLELEMIEGICTIPPGGWLVENNFKFVDLDEGEQARLFSKKPLLAPPDYIIDAMGLTEGSIDIVNTLLKEMAAGFEIDLLPENLRRGYQDYVSVAKFIEVKEFINEWGVLSGNHQAQWAYKVIVEGDDIEGYYIDHVSRGDMKDFLTSVMYKYPKLSSRLGHLLRQAYEEEGIEPEDELDFEDDDDIATTFAEDWSSLGLIGDAIQNAVQRSMEDGLRSGTEQSVVKTFQSWINNMEVGVLRLLINRKDPDYFMEKSCVLAVSVNNLVKGLLTQEFLEEVENNGSFESAIKEHNRIEDLGEHDYSDYDEEHALEEFESVHLDDELENQGIEAKTYE